VLRPCAHREQVLLLEARLVGRAAIPLIAEVVFNPEALVAHRLKPYEDRADRLLARKAFPPEAKITNPALRPFLEAVGKVYVALGRSPAPAA